MGKKARERREQYERRAAEARREKVMSSGTYWEFLLHFFGNLKSYDGMHHVWRTPTSSYHLPHVDESVLANAPVYLEMLNSVESVIKIHPFDNGEVFHDKYFEGDYRNEDVWTGKNALEANIASLMQASIHPPFESVFVEWETPWFEFQGHTEYDRVGVLIRHFRLSPHDKNEMLMCDIFRNPPYSTHEALIIEADENFFFKKTITDDDLIEYSLVMDDYYQALKTLEFLNCRNIVLIDNEPDAEASREYERHFGRPLTKYKTLGVKSFSRKYDRDYEGNPYQGIMPLHIRRGHFATYTEDAPLFGKYTGTFWRPATVVGEQDNGIVVKDYEVKP